MAKSEKRRKSARLPAQIDRAIAAAEDKKAVDLVVLDLRKAAGFTDFFVIASGTNARQVRALRRAARPSHPRSRLRALLALDSAAHAAAVRSLRRSAADLARD